VATAVGAGAATAPAPGPSKAGRGRGPLERRDRRAALLFISPWIIGFLVFTLWPVLYTGYLSFTDYDVINDPHFVGFDNFKQLLDDPKVALALQNTFVYTLMVVPAQVLVALALALLLDKAGRASGFFRTAFYLPKMTPPVAIGVLFLLLFNGQSGLFNAMLGTLGVNGPSWTTDPTWVKPGLVIMSLWTLGGSVIILLAALRNVPQELYDAARVDGAGYWRQTRSVTVPMISGALFFILIIETIAAFQSFSEAYTAFFGSGNSTYSNDAALFYSIYLFQQAFQFLHMGYASAMAWILFAIIMVVTFVQVRFTRRFVYYEGEAS
jgi:multiple sugar transport system permease protein